MKDSLKTRSLDALRRPAAHFQRAINLKYDLADAKYIAAYVPTPNGTQAIKRLLNSTRPRATQRATVLHGPYGSGKSLLATVVAAIVSRDGTVEEALSPVVDRLMRIDPETAQLVESYLRRGPRMLPVILSGDEGQLDSSLLRGLTEALERAGLADIRPRTHYQAALATIEMWETDYPDTYQRLVARLRAEQHSLQELSQGLKRAESSAYALFQGLYPALTAGATFDNHFGQSVIDAYQETVATLHAETDYNGVVILWDEFGRFLEARASEPFGREAALLQDFAEFANRSNGQQVHLALITHKAMSGYAWGLPDKYMQEWQRISQRFRPLDVSGDPLIAYRLISSALSTTDSEAWDGYLRSHQDALAQMMGHTIEQRVFPELEEGEIRQWVLEGSYPLHPSTVYCLPRLSNQVAQNERTLFTFLAADEPGTLREHLTRIPLDDALHWVNTDILYDYFAEAMRADTGPGGVHTVWASAQHALGKLPSDQVLARRFVKALAVLQAVGETDVLRPTASALAFALGVTVERVEEAARYLVRRKLARLHRLDHTWELAVGSDVDVEAAVADVLDRRRPNAVQLRRLLERSVRSRPYQARRYNAEHGVIRFFREWYRYPDEIEDVNWDAVLTELNYADGLVVYLLARNGAELDQAKSVIEATVTDRVLFVLPKRPVLIDDPLHELFALTELKNDPIIREKDERVLGELEFFIEDARGRIEQTLDSLIDPRKGGADWYWRGERWREFSIDSSGRVTRLLSLICDEVFPATPVLRNEGLNRRKPSKVQQRAAETVAEALLVDQIDEQLGISGHGPDWLIVNTILKAPGILDVDESGAWDIGVPRDPQMARVWKEIKAFFEDARDTSQPWADLLDDLQSPPFGMRLGVLPVLLAAALRGHLRVATIRRNGKPIFPLTGELFVDLCRHSERYTLELGPESESLRIIWSLLEDRFADHTLPEERRRQPLRYLSLGMVRWLRGLDRFAQTTRSVSDRAREFRRLIKIAEDDPSPVLFEKLPVFLEEGLTLPAANEEYEAAVASELDALMGELKTAYPELLRRLDRFAIDLFGAGANGLESDGQGALNQWAIDLEERCGCALSELRLGDVRAEGIIRISRSEARGPAFWDALAREVSGLAPRDWDDTGEERFYEVLAAAKGRLEQEVLGLATEESAGITEVYVQTGGDSDRRYRFRQVPLSRHAERILNNFKHRLRVSGRPLSPDERRQVVVALLQHVMGEEDA